LASNLSDLPNITTREPPPTDFDEGMRLIYEALHPYVDEDAPAAARCTRPNHCRRISESPTVERFGNDRIDIC